MRLITMPHSHYCEKARWALDLVGAPYREEPHLPLLHRLHTSRHGGGSVPMLVTANQTYTDSAAIARFAAICRPGSGLIPGDLETRQAAWRWEHYFDTELGPSARCWAYFHLLALPALLDKLASRAVPLFEQALAPLLMPLVRPLIASGLRINTRSASEALECVWKTFRTVADHLRQGNAFLAGTELSLADISFAALAAPVLLPPDFGGACPSVEDVPQAMRVQTMRLRESVAGEFAAAVYKQFRRRTANYTDDV